MVKTIDYYGYWNKNRKKGFYIWDREKSALKLMSKIVKNNFSILDAGCGNGRFMEIILQNFPNSKIKLKGIDYSKSEIAEALKKGLNVKKVNLEEGIKFKANSFDIVYAGEVIEHLYNPDFFLSEVNRILKKGGYFVFSTPNLCAWFNRILMPLGIQPIFLEPSTKSKFVGAGILKGLKKESQPVGHVRIFTIAALRDMLKMNDFKLLDVKGSLFDEGIPKSILWLDKIFTLVPSLSSQFVILAKKIG